MDALQATGLTADLAGDLQRQLPAGSARGVAIDGQRSLLVMLDRLERGQVFRSRAPEIAATHSLPRCRFRRIRDGRDHRGNFETALKTSAS